ncbi:hypothetical protein ACR9YC_02970 [Parasphingorhabdus sp. DH2-15]|uniref:hypothetical protein n=1 Tax=Parasphingorhabdus sp. DH2-15 TaxID=3444112 RepID=UPI003F684F35
MPRLTVLLAPIAFFSLLSGCVALAIPIVAAGAIGKTSIDRAREKAGLIAVTSEQSEPIVTVGNADAENVTDEPAATDVALRSPKGELRLSDILASPPGAERDNRLPSLATPYERFLSVSLERQRLWDEGQWDQSAVLVPRVSLVSPKSMTCQDLPPAVIIDVDRGSSDKAEAAPFRFSAPGLPAILTQLREAEITVIWLSARPAEQALTIIQELKANNLLPEGESDFVSLNRSTDDRKQLRRWAAAEIYCILATLGDARGDFDELYDYLLDPDFAVALERNFNNGWFLVTDEPQSRDGQDEAQSADASGRSKRSEFFNLQPNVIDTDNAPDETLTPDEKEDDNG